MPVTLSGPSGPLEALSLHIAPPPPSVALLYLQVSGVVGVFVCVVGGGEGGKGGV